MQRIPQAVSPDELERIIGLAVSGKLAPEDGDRHWLPGDQVATLASHSHRAVRLLAAAQVAIDPADAERLSTDPDDEVRGFTALVAPLPGRAVERLATDPSSLVRQFLARSERELPDEVIRRLAADAETAVRAGLAERPRGVPVDVVRALACDPKGVVRDAVLKTYVWPEALDDTPLAPAEVSFALLGYVGGVPSSSLNPELAGEVEAWPDYAPGWKQAPQGAGAIGAQGDFHDVVAWRRLDQERWTFLVDGKREGVAGSATGWLDLPKATDGFFRLTFSKADEVVAEGATLREQSLWKWRTPGKRAGHLASSAMRLDLRSHYPEAQSRLLDGAWAVKCQALLISHFGLFALWNDLQGSVGWTLERSTAAVPKERILIPNDMIPGHFHESIEHAETMIRRELGRDLAL